MNFSKTDIQDLIKDCADGKEKALKTFFDHFAQDIYNFPIRVFHLTEDDASEFFIYAYERLKSGKRFQSFKGKSSFKTWLYTVLRNMLIDWKRNKKEVKIVSNHKVNSDGVEYFTIDNEPDTRVELKNEALSVSEKFQEALNSIKIENRVIFKLAYIYYLNLDEDEVKYILQKTGMDLETLKKRIMEIREELSKKETESIHNEDKITSIYLSILELRELENKEKPRVFSDNLPSEDKIQIALQKKYEQRKKLLERKQKGNFLTRTPYKLITSLLDIPEGGISISLQRVVEKIQKKIVI